MSGTPGEAVPATCAWRQDEEGVWETACGEAHLFIEGNPRDNNHRFCPYCGRPIEEGATHV